MRGGGGEGGGVKYEPKTKARLIDELTPVTPGRLEPELELRW